MWNFAWGRWQEGWQITCGGWWLLGIYLLYMSTACFALLYTAVNGPVSDKYQSPTMSWLLPLPFKSTFMSTSCLKCKMRHLDNIFTLHILCLFLELKISLLFIECSNIRMPHQRHLPLNSFNFALDGLSRHTQLHFRAISWPNKANSSYLTG